MSETKKRKVFSAELNPDYALEKIEENLGKLGYNF